MRRSALVAAAALIAASALIGLPGPAATKSPSSARAVDPAVLSFITVPATVRPSAGPGPDEGALRSAGFSTEDTTYQEPGVAPDGPTSRVAVDQPESDVGSAWKKPKYTISGYATFYDHGTTAMRLPRGTVVRICGKAGCIERTVTDWGPQKPSRVVDLYRPDFFKICGCDWYAGTTWVTIGVY